MRNYRKIKAWQLADEIALAVYGVTRNFPKEEMYGLTSQLRRAATSVPANIVEGAMRGHKKEYLQFLHISRGSLAEVDYFLHLAHRLEYISSVDHEKVSSMVDLAGATLHRLIEAVAKEC